MSWPATNLGGVAGDGEAESLAETMTAVLMPTTRPRLSTRGPPELPGLSAASVWMMSSMRRPDWEAEGAAEGGERRPAVTVAWKPRGLPMAMTIWPAGGGGIAEVGGRKPVASVEWRDDGEIVWGSSPTRVAPSSRPSASWTRICQASWTTWEFVRTRPSG